MIVLNGAIFGETHDVLDFDKLAGYARRLKRQIKLFNTDNELIGVINKWGALLCATKLDDGRYWYNFSTIQEIGEYASYMQSRDEIDSLAVAKTAHSNGERLYRFK